MRSAAHACQAVDPYTFSGQRLQEDKQGAQQHVIAGETLGEAEEVHQEVEVVPFREARTTASAWPLRCQLGRPESRALLEEFAKQAAICYELGTPNVMHLADTVRSNVFHAFARNVQVLGFDDSWLTYDAISPFNKHRPHRMSDPNPSDYPANMCPTALQTSVEHHPWIDLFPCPRMRDNFLGAVLIHGESAVDEDALCYHVVDAGAGTGIEAAAMIAWTDP